MHAQQGRQTDGQRRVERDRLWHHGLPLRARLRQRILPRVASEGLGHQELQTRASFAGDQR